MTLAWLDKRVVYMYSTHHNGTTEEVERRKRGGEAERIQKPSVICDYTKNMGSVDRFDHYSVSYNFERKTVKWWRKTFYWLLEVAVVNSYILWCQCHTQEKRRHLAYRKDLICELVREHRATRVAARRGRPSAAVALAERLNNGLHCMHPLDDNKLKDCVVCTNRKQGIRKRTRFICNTCTSKPGMCPGTCFERYHTLEDYKL